MDVSKENACSPNSSSRTLNQSTSFDPERPPIAADVKGVANPCRSLFSISYMVGGAVSIVSVGAALAVKSSAKETRFRAGAATVPA